MNQNLSRRDFLKTTGKATAAISALAGIALPAVHAQGSDQFKLALIGCGGRGGGATNFAPPLRTESAKLVAMADVFENKLNTAFTSLKRDHYAAFPVGQRSDRARAEVRRQHAVESVRTSAPLKVPQDHATCLSPRNLFEIVLQVLADTAEPGCTRTITLVLINQLVPDLDRAFGDHDNTKVRSRRVAHTHFLDN